MSALASTLEFAATLAGALFAGAALYISVAEHPARMGLETRAAALQWAPSYKRATWLQAPLAVVSLVCGVAVWLLGAGSGWLVVRWGRLHTVRTALSLVGATIYLWLLLVA
jgi:hypothetical protein